MTRSALPYAAVPLTAALLVAAGLFWGGIWLAIAILFLMAFAIGYSPDEPADEPHEGLGWVPVLLGLAHFGILAIAVTTLARAQSAGFAMAGFLAAGLYLGHVSNPTAHELIHRRDRAGFWLGVLVYSSILFGHHASAHRLVHHTHVATDRDPNSARAGESLYAFLPRAWIGSFRAGFAIEHARTGGLFPWASYGIYILVALGFMGLALLIGGPAGLAVHLCLSAYATVQLLTSDYVQHYGLRRKTDAQGRPEPVGPEHSWDAPTRGPGWLMLNAPRHASHHVHPAVPFGALATTGRELPHSLAVMGVIAFLPRRWRRIMDRRLPAS